MLLFVLLLNVRIVFCIVAVVVECFPDVAVDVCHQLQFLMLLHIMKYRHMTDITKIISCSKEHIIIS